MVVALRHKSIFDGLNGAQYFHAIQKLSKSNPCAAYVIKGCYLISIIEVVFLFVYEKIIISMEPHLMRTFLFSVSLVLMFYAIFPKIFLAMSYATPSEVKEYWLSLKSHKNGVIKKIYFIIEMLGGRRMIAGCIGFAIFMSVLVF